MGITIPHVGVLNILDIGIILIILMFMIVGFKRGVIREVVSLVGIIIVFLISYGVKGFLGNFFALIFPFFKLPGGNQAINILLYQALAFILVFTFLLSLYEILTKVSKFIQKIINMTIILWLPSKLLGALVGFIKGYILVYVLLIILMIPLGGSTYTEDSLLTQNILYETIGVSDLTNSFITSVKEVSNVTFTKSKKSTKEINRDTIEIMLKYDMVDTKTVKELVKLRKIEIDKVDELVEKYGEE